MLHGHCCHVITATCDMMPPCHKTEPSALGQKEHSPDGVHVLFYDKTQINKVFRDGPLGNLKVKKSVLHLQMGLPRMMCFLFWGMTILCIKILRTSKIAMQEFKVKTQKM